LFSFENPIVLRPDASLRLERRKVMRLKSRGWLPRLRKGTSLATVFIYALALGTPTLSAAATAPAEGGLSVVTDPEGAAVYVNGESKGVTPLQLDRIAAGDHRVTVVKDGYLENSRVVRVEAGETRALQVQLTSSAGQARHAAQITPGGGGGGGVPTWVWIAAAAGGGTAAYLLLRPTNDPPTAGSVSINPATGLQAATSFSISSQGASDPDGDTLSYSWDLGDSTSATGQSVTKVYNTAGNFTATVTVSDGEESATASGSVTVRGMTGNWRGSFPGYTFTMNLSQSGSSVTGSYSDAEGPGTVSGSVSAPNNVRLTVRQPQFDPFTFSGTTSADVNSVTGVINGSGFVNTGFSMTRQ
jgi:hypothetical protein